MARKKFLVETLPLEAKITDGTVKHRNVCDDCDGKAGRMRAQGEISIVQMESVEHGGVESEVGGHASPCGDEAAVEQFCAENAGRFGTPDQRVDQCRTWCRRDHVPVRVRLAAITPKSVHRQRRAGDTYDVAVREMRG